MTGAAAAAGGTGTTGAGGTAAAAGAGGAAAAEGGTGTASAGRGPATVDLLASSENSSLRRAAWPAADAAVEFSAAAFSAAAAGATASPGTGWPLAGRASRAGGACGSKLEGDVLEGDVLAGWTGPAWTGIDIPTDGQACALSAGVAGGTFGRAGPPWATSTRAPPGPVPLARTGTAGAAVLASVGVPVTCAVFAGIAAADAAVAAAALAGAEAGGAEAGGRVSARAVPGTTVPGTTVAGGATAEAAAPLLAPEGATAAGHTAGVACGCPAERTGAPAGRARVPPRAAGWRVAPYVGNGGAGATGRAASAAAARLPSAVSRAADGAAAVPLATRPLTVPRPTARFEAAASVAAPPRRKALPGAPGATSRVPGATPPEAAVPPATAPPATAPPPTATRLEAAALAAGTGTRGGRSGTPGLRRASEPRSSKAAMLAARSRGSRLLCHTRAVTVIWSFSASGAIRHHTRGSAR
jgi:hypothetical protein